MTNRTRKKLIFACMGGAILLAGTFFNGCRVDPKVLPETTSEQVKFYIPDGFPQPVYTFAGNEVTLAGFTLGRKLFYDPRLSADNTISCGFCHQAPASFANANHALSHGIGGQFGRRNAPVLVNLAWNQSFMWDGGINHIENQPPAPIQNPVEMGETMSNVILKLSAVPSYHDDFKAAFGDDSITTQR
ncbi:MAG TPA: cytochrome-c peroxidase, partial [Bacteroidia bacterium]|nr:cytochrome-c peroxidase [Bacteroidia bacterium]